MNKPLITLLLLIALANGYSQGAYFQTGKNFTKYEFKSKTGTPNIDFQTGIGSNFEIGYEQSSGNKKFAYTIGLTLNEYNTKANSNLNSYTWETEYVGLQNSFQYNVIKTTYINIGPIVGLNIDTIIYGEQQTNGLLSDLTREKEFSGIQLIQFIGIQVKSKLSEYGYLSLVYNYSKSINISNSSEEQLSFRTKQIQFGVHFNFSKKVTKKVLLNP